MSSGNAIRADYDKSTVVVYQAYSPAIAGPALAAKQFVSPFSFHRMTWIKPSYLWLMERSNWGQKSGQEQILAIRITRSGWEEALAIGVLTHPDPTIYPDPDDWQARFAAAHVHLQWDPERSLRGGVLPLGSLQVDLSRHVIRRYVEEWTVDITDYTPRTRKIHDLLRRGKADAARRLLPPERDYPVPKALAHHIGAT